MMPLVVDSLATFRLTRLLQQDEITEPFRERIDQVLAAAGWRKSRTLLTCPWCAGIWLAAGVVAARRFVPDVWDPVARVLAFSAVAGVIAEQV